MTHQANAVYQEIDLVGISGLVHDLQPGLVDLRANSRASLIARSERSAAVVRLPGQTGVLPAR